MAGANPDPRLAILFERLGLIRRALDRRAFVGAVPDVVDLAELEASAREIEQAIARVADDGAFRAPAAPAPPPPRRSARRPRRA